MKVADICRFRSSCPARPARGVSLVEALVALAVMAFGILGTIGVQATLRLNGDVAKQRAEAVRIAQEEIERWRSFTVLAMPVPPNGHTTAFDDLLTTPGPVAVAGVTSNTTFNLTREVTTASTAPAKALSVEVSWTDRSGVPQSVMLNSQIAGALPEVSGALGMATTFLANTQSRTRNAGVPLGAIDQGDGTSNFAPPGSTGVNWVFSNTTGLITCVGTTGTPCVTTTNATLLSGYVRFALRTNTSGTPLAPTSTDAEIPASPAPLSGIFVRDDPGNPLPLATVCYSQTAPSGGYIGYACAVPLPPAAPFQWSGRTTLDGLPKATSLGSSDRSLYKVCRYTPEASDTPTGGNAAHPYDYVDVSTSLNNQNFLVIYAGDGTTGTPGTVFTCPGDDAATTFINGNTRAHDPHS